MRRAEAGGLRIRAGRAGREARMGAAADPGPVALLPNLNFGFVANSGIHAVSRFSLAQSATVIEGGWGGFGGGLQRVVPGAGLAGQGLDVWNGRLTRAPPVLRQDVG